MSEIRSQATPARDEPAEAMKADLIEADGRNELLWYDNDDYAFADLDAITATLLAAGWSKPRTVNSATELDALPIGSAVAVALYPQKWHHGVWVKTDTDEWSSHSWRAKRDNESMAVGPEGAITPATVLFTPGDAG